MKLASALSSQFDDGVRSRGASYFRSGAVRILSGSASEVQARVRGSRLYDLEISWDGRKLTLFCDCPYFETAGPCKHLWATILASDAKDYFSTMTRFDPKSVVYDTPGDVNGDDEAGSDDEEPDEDEDSEEDPVYESPTRHFLPIPPSGAKPQPRLVPQPQPWRPTPAPKPQPAPHVWQPSWRERLQEVASSKPAAGADWPADRT